MKPTSFKEIDLVLEEVQGLVDQSVTEVIFHKDILLIGFYVEGENRWLILDASKRTTALLIGDSRLPRFKKEIKPLYLFLKTRLKGQKLVKAVRNKEYGRVVLLNFEELEMEMQLTPTVKNIIVRTPEQQISLNKPKELQPVEDKGGGGEPRLPAELFTQWLEEYKPKPRGDSSKDFKKLIKKKERDLEKVEERLKTLEQGRWRKLADILNQSQSLEVAEEWEALVDREKSLAENIQGAYVKAKKEEAKHPGLLERREQLTEELKDLKESPGAVREIKKAPNLFKGQAKGRTKTVAEGIVAYVGKSAKDNLRLLRNAKSWHLWLHIKDRPGAYGIISRDKKKKVTDQQLKEVAQWVLEHSLSEKQRKDWSGLQCEFLVCECRYVVPIKGDKLGRTTYKNERALSVYCN